MNIRLHGTPDETKTAADLLGQVVEVVSIRGPYRDRPPSSLVRVYLEVRLPAPTRTRSGTGSGRLHATATRLDLDTGREVDR
jgi:hypothetical protein